MKKECGAGEHCKAMEEMLDKPDESRRGFSAVTTLNIKTGKFRYIGVRYCKTDRSKDRGVMLNFCPFCGESIQWWEK